MALARTLRRTLPLVAIAAAGAVVARRRNEGRGAGRPLPAGSPPWWPEPSQPVVPPVEVSHGSEAGGAPEPPPPEPAPAQAPLPSQELSHGSEDETAEFSALPDDDAASVTDIVDDLLAPHGPPVPIEDATVVEGDAEEA